MKICFVDRPISQGPITVLRHLYYYTVQYGLSVKQYTGAHQNYWAALPARLREARRSPAALGRVIRELERLAAGAERRLAQRRAQVKGGKWAEKEIVLNAQLLAVLAALPENLLAATFRRLAGFDAFPATCRVVNLTLEKERDGENTDFVEPDLLLRGEDALLMVELKTRGGATSARRYPPTQLLNYLRLVVECRVRGSDQLPTRFAHLIIVPAVERRWLEHEARWVRVIAAGRLVVDADACLGFANAYARRHWGPMRQALEDVPIFYRSWKELGEAYKEVTRGWAGDPHASHWERLGRELRDLAYRAGRFRGARSHGAGAARKRRARRDAGRRRTPPATGAR